MIWTFSWIFSVWTWRFLTLGALFPSAWTKTGAVILGPRLRLKHSVCLNSGTLGNLWTRLFSQPGSQCSFHSYCGENCLMWWLSESCWKYTNPSAPSLSWRQVPTAAQRKKFYGPHASRTTPTNKSLLKRNSRAIKWPLNVASYFECSLKYEQNFQVSDPSRGSRTQLSTVQKTPCDKINCEHKDDSEMNQTKCIMEINVMRMMLMQ